MTDVKLSITGVYVIKAGGKWLDLDSQSGGYPYLVDSFLRAYRFSTLERAVREVESSSGYIQEDMEVFEVESVNLKSCLDELKKSKAYEAELAALNKKYGKE
jgi:hypothetical protein